ncbi:cellobiose dehydrogenase [Xylariales sp. PMI_506]|nr:cellobiose dehydrogenase [Xylariales sp. PMI_506]
MPSFWSRSLLALGSAAGASALCAKTAAVNNSTSPSYDYIVVGGGPSGIIAATRLAQTNKTVILIERGVGPTVGTGNTETLSWNDTLTGIDVPGLSTSVWTSGPAANYLCDDTEGMAGCVLGGGASVNYMVFIHPPAHDFNDKWPAGWKWADIEPAAERVYALNPGSMLPSADGQRYDQGMYEVVSEFFDAEGWSSVNQVEQPNEKHAVYSYPNWDVGNQLRVGPTRTYLPLAEELDNFTLKLNTTVRRVIRSGTSATGVEIKTSDGSIETVSLADGGKVVLAAGTWSTPRILINSGIGPQEQIETVQNGTTGITLPPQADWINLPVGQGLKDHAIFGLTIQTNASFSLYNATTAYVAGEAALSDIELYEQQASGVLTQGYHRLTWWTSNVGSDNITRYYQGSTAPSGDGQFSIKAYLTHGLTSSGSMGVDADGNGVYVGDAPYLTTQADVDAATSLLDDLVARFEAYPGWSMVGWTNASDALAAYTAGDHYVGTAKIGTSAADSVVDTNVKVHGTDNIYVVDASIHADLPTGNTQCITMVVAEAAVARIISPQ